MTTVGAQEGTRRPQELCPQQSAPVSSLSQLAPDAGQVSGEQRSQEPQVAPVERAEAPGLPGVPGPDHHAAGGPGHAPGRDCPQHA